MKHCPSCGSARYKSGPLGSYCKKCGYRNHPNHLMDKEKNNEKNKQNFG